MARIGRFFKFLGKWTLILGGVFLFAIWMNSLEPDNRLWFLLFGLAMAIAYVEGSLKDRIQALEWRVDDLSRRLSRYD